MNKVIENNFSNLNFAEITPERMDRNARGKKSIMQNGAMISAAMAI